MSSFSLDGVSGILKRTIFFAFATLPALDAHAQTGKVVSSALPVATIRFDGTSSIPPDIARLIGSVGEVTAVTPSTDTALSDLVYAHCGDVDASYSIAVSAANPLRAIDTDLTHVRIKPGDIINLPVCLPAPSLEVVERRIQPNDSEWIYWTSRQSGVPWRAGIKSSAQTTDPITVNDTATVMWNAAASKFIGSDNQALYFRDVFAAANGLNRPLRAGETALLPTVAPRVISVRPKADDNANFVSNLGNVIRFVAAVNGSDAPFEIGNEFQQVTEVSEGCVASNLDPQRSDDEFASILSTINSTIRTNDLEPLQRVRIKVLDSGLVLTDNGIVRRDRVYVAKGAPGGIRATGSADFTPLSVSNLQTVRDHGTKVASLALGGFSRSHAWNGAGFTLQILSVRIYDLKVERPFSQNGAPFLDGAGKPIVLQTGRIDEAKVLAELGRDDADVVNLSLGRNGRIEGLEREFKSEGKVVFVAAAGNYGKDLTDPANSFFPASYGGNQQGRDNLITVASIDGNGLLSGFSNFGADIVDIAAPGCKLKAEGFDFDTSQTVKSDVSGTSFSAPQVSFVAALLKAIFPDWKASEIKNRILATADIEEDLVGFVTDGRVLNPSKAVSVFQDIVEISDAEGRRSLYRGEVASPSDIRTFCSDLTLPSGTPLLRVRFDFDGVKKDTLSNFVYWIDVGGNLKKSKCKALNPDVELRGLSGTSVLKGESIRDVVYAAMYPRSRIELSR